MEVDRKKLEEILEDLDHDCPKTAAMSVHQILNTNDDTLDFDGYDSALCIDTAVKSICTNTQFPSPPATSGLNSTSVFTAQYL